MPITESSHTSISDMLKQVGAVPDGTQLTDAKIVGQLIQQQETLEQRRQKALELGVDVDKPLTGHEKPPEDKRDLDIVTNGAGDILVAMYEVTVDHIIGGAADIFTGEAATLSGRVSDADLAAAGVDKEFLLRIGNIVPAGYAKV